MNRLELMKELLGIEKSDTSRDTILNFYLTKSETIIKKYSILTDEEYTGLNLDNQNVELAIYYYNNKNQVGVKSYSEGKRSVSYTTSDIPVDIKESLPKPRIVFM